MAQSHARSGELVSVLPLAASLAASRTTAILKAHELEVIRVVLQAGRTMAEHAAPGEITLQCLEGVLALASPQGTVQMHAGDLVHLGAGKRHALQAITDTSALLTISLRTADAG